MPTDDEYSQFQRYADTQAYADAIASVEKHVCDWLSGDRRTQIDLENYNFPIYVKNRERVLSLVNESYRVFFSRGEVPIGKHSDNVLTDSIAKVSAKTDALILDGYSRLELEHIGLCPTNRRYLMRTHKVDVSGYGYDPFQIMGVSIPFRVLETKDGERGVEDLFRIYAEFNREFKQICTMYALGETTRSIAERLGKSARTIENYRHEILKQLGLSKPVEIIRLLVRFEERGLIGDFGEGAQ